MAEKMTKVQMYNSLKAKYELTEDEVAFINHEICLLEKKNQKSATGEKKPSKAQIESANLANVLYDEMEVGKQYLITDMMKNLPTCEENGLTPQKITSLMNVLLRDGKVVRETIKGKGYYSRPAEAIEADE